MFPEHIVWSTKIGWIFAALHYFKIGILGIPTIVSSFKNHFNKFKSIPIAGCCHQHCPAGLRGNGSALQNVEEEMGRGWEEDAGSFHRDFGDFLLFGHHHYGWTLRFAFINILCNIQWFFKGFILVKLWHEFSGVSVVFICLCEMWVFHPLYFNNLPQFSVCQCAFTTVSGDIWRMFFQL